jgi:hypothetical protein
MALKDITSQKDLIAEANKTRRDRIEKGNKARAEQREEARKANYLRQRREGMNIAYNQFKHSGTEGIDTGEDQGAVSKFLFGEDKNLPKYQAAREMKKALESERARVNIPDELDEQRKAMYDSAKKDDMDLPAGARTYKKGGKVKCMSKGGSTASKRADGCATKGKTKGRII